MHYYPNLFKPLKIKHVTFRNRIFSTPNQTRFKGNFEMAYEEAKARGGAAQVTIGETPITSKYVRQSGAYTLILDDPHDMRLAAETALAIKLHGAAASIQLSHVGQYTVLHSKNDLNPIGPMGFERKDGVEVIAMDEDMIEETTEAYANAAAYVKRAGFDSCQVHGAHGWLLSQFLSPLTNRRKDRYGGSLENRARFPRAVVERIREKCGPDFLIEYRISGDDLVEGGMRIDGVIEFLKMIEKTIDLVHISAGWHESRETIHRHVSSHLLHRAWVQCIFGRGSEKSSRYSRHHRGWHFRSCPRRAESSRKVRPYHRHGESLARRPRASQQSPQWGRRHEIIPCLRCNNCLLGVGFNDIIACAADPQTGRESRWQAASRPAASRKVLVIGGGPAGMKAAITAHERGHDVTLWEKSDSLGGLLKISDHDPLKSDVRVFKNYLVNRTLALVKVRLDTEATPELIERLAPDVVIAAVGSTPLRPDIPGIEREKVITALDAYYDAAKVGEKVVVIGGGLVGCETGLYLAEQGKHVTIVEMTDAVGDPVNWRHTVPLVMRMDATPTLTHKTGLKCREVTPSGIKVADTQGKEHLVEADTVILAVGMQSNSDTVDRLRRCVPDFYPVGDCVKPQRIMEAMQGGYFAALDIL